MILALAKIAGSLFALWLIWRCVDAIDHDEVNGKFEIMGAPKRLRDNLP